MIPKYCLCGCGQQINQTSTFIRGHHNKINKNSVNKMVQTRKKNGSYVAWNKGKKGLVYYGPFKKGHKINLGKKYKNISEEKKKNMGGWNRGLTKETSAVLLESGKKISLGNLGKQRTNEQRINYSLSKRGQNNPQYLGGISNKPYTYDFNTLFKEKIRERDTHCCFLCNKTEYEISRKLAIHHIDYNKLNSFVQNCVSLCMTCHALTNINRKYWTIFFQSLLKERYQYEYTESQQIILNFCKGDEK